MRATALLLSSLLLVFGACQPSTSSSRLENMPRHDEWVDIKQGDRTVRAYVVYPERADKGPAIVVIHENRGLTDWVRTVADRLAENGYIAIAPDLLSGTAPNGGGTKDYASEDAAREGISKLPRPQVLADLRATVDYAKKIPSANGKVSVGGFCWGGSQTWLAANEIPELSGAYVFYGTGPQDAAGVANIQAPVFGFYGGADARVNATIPKTEELMKGAGKRFEPVIYDGAGHAFMRAGEASDATEPNRKAMEEGWKRWLEVIR
ncbi:MAG TPA: dienelactone hydrolase family protein [Thermoanaerobaculia bacterium]|nr:dienelactone hydrolase family protein [Thermoanaerobaculia bacterium]